MTLRYLKNLRHGYPNRGRSVYIIQPTARYVHTLNSHNNLGG